MNLPVYVPRSKFPAAIFDRFVDLPPEIARGPEDAKPLVVPAGASEHLFLAIRRFSATNVVRVISLEGAAPSPLEVRSALRALQSRHPLARVRVVDGHTPCFVHGVTRPIPLHVVARRDDSHWHELLHEVLDRPLEQDRGPLIEVHYVHSAPRGRSELLVVADHSICDGISMNQLCAELVGLLAGHAPEAPRPLRPVLEGMLPRYPLSVRIAGFLPSLAIFARTGLERVLFEKRVRARVTRHVFLELDAADTKALVARARQEGTTVTGALLSAVAFAVRGARPDARRIAVSVPVNLRPRIPDAGLASSDLANTTSVAYLETRARGDRWDVARRLKAGLDEVAGSFRILAALPLVYRGGRMVVSEGKAPFAHAMISNSGVVPIETDAGRFRVRAFHSATSAPMLSADFAFFCNTLDDRLTINLVFAQEVVSPDLAERVLADVRERLLAP